MEDNIDKVLRLMENETNRKARFRTVIAFILNGEEFLFEGIIAGTIIRETERQLRIRIRSRFYPRWKNPYLCRNVAC